MLVSLLTATVINQINLLNQQARQQTGVLEAILRGVKVVCKWYVSTLSTVVLSNYIPVIQVKVKESSIFAQ